MARDVLDAAGVNLPACEPRSCHPPTGEPHARPSTPTRWRTWSRGRCRPRGAWARATRWRTSAADRPHLLPPRRRPLLRRQRLTPGAVPFEPSFSEAEPNILRFTIEPLGPEASPVSRRDEATREMRRLIRRCSAAMRCAGSTSQRGVSRLRRHELDEFRRLVRQRLRRGRPVLDQDLLRVDADPDRRAVASLATLTRRVMAEMPSADADLHLDRLQARHRQPARDLPASRAADDQRARAR